MSYDQQPDPHADDPPAPPPEHTAPTYQAAPPKPVGVYCHVCGYDLTGVAIGSNCPECGALVDPSFQQASAPASGFSIASMVLGICSILGCMCYGVPGLICGILAIIFNRKAKAQLEEGRTGSGSEGMATAGLITGIIGLALSLLYTGIFVVYFILIAIGTIQP